MAIVPWRSQNIGFFQQRRHLLTPRYVRYDKFFIMRLVAMSDETSAFKSASRSGPNFSGFAVLGLLKPGDVSRLQYLFCYRRYTREPYMYIYQSSSISSVAELKEFNDPAKRRFIQG